MKWEYYTVAIIGSAVEVEQKLDEFGEKGWELFEREGNDFLFKRPVPELPVELEEAAEHFIESYPDVENLREYGIGIISFKAGAEWGRKQALQEIHDEVDLADRE